MATPTTQHRPVHPRACGEQNFAIVVGLTTSGSSPRVRGTGAGVTDDPVCGRFIPARAGNSASSFASLTASSVHPRACGEQLGPTLADNKSLGSSPRVRGTGRYTTGSRSICRFIPARAGNRMAKPSETTGSPVHPRACGEQTRFTGPSCHLIGSSPRVRGTASVPLVDDALNRFIPARAGNRSERSRLSVSTPVHPRACGEQCPQRWHWNPSIGSSPRVRGTVVTLRPRRAGFRFIPARAGNSGVQSGARQGHPVHPRACGEQWPWS